MSHISVRKLIEDCARTLGDAVQFGYGRQTEFNQIPNKRYPYVWLAPLTSTTVYSNDMMLRTWACSILFFDLDSDASIAPEYNKILDRLDIQATKFIQTLNQTVFDQPGDIVVSSISANPLYKDTSDVCTGWLLSFQLTTPDDFDYCSIETVTREDEHC